jgi:hypothetical protein
MAGYREKECPHCGTTHKKRGPYCSRSCGNHRVFSQKERMEKSKKQTEFLKERKIKVPDDVAVIGFSNTDLTDLIDPPLSVIRQPAFEMGEDATELLLTLIRSKKPVTKFETRIHTTELLIKKST